MRVAIPQLNYRIGKIQENTNMMLAAVKKAKSERADLIVFSELAVCGAFPEDLLEREDFVNECRLAVEKIASACQNIAAIVGAPNLDSENGIMYNSAYFIQNGEVVDGVHKTILSDYDIFDESRYFIAGEDNEPVKLGNQNIRILFDEYEADYIDKTDHLVVHIGVSPFTTEALAYRQQAFGSLSKKYSKNIVVVNPVGGHTSVVFDGNSMIYNYKGALIHQSDSFREDFSVIDLAKSGNLPVVKNVTVDRIAMIHKALVVTIRDYFATNGFTKAVLGLSGGIDSAVVAALAAEALGKENVVGLLMPSEFSTDHSVQDALDLANNIGMPHEVIPIKEMYEQYIKALNPHFGNLPFNVAEENLQARIRGGVVMAMSNKFGYIALNTSNKSEIAVGYGTLYGDMCGSLSVIGDIYKTDVFRLARHINSSQSIIPENTIVKAPSAELRPNQKDNDSLPDYNVLDAILTLYIEENCSVEMIISKGFNRDIVAKTIRMVNSNNYKRAQCPPIIKMSRKAFGKGVRMPF